jgi:hypothetical protein
VEVRDWLVAWNVLRVPAFQGPENNESGLSGGAETRVCSGVAAPCQRWAEVRSATYVCTYLRDITTSAHLCTTSQATAHVHNITSSSKDSIAAMCLLLIFFCTGITKFIEKSAVRLSNAHPEPRCAGYKTPIAMPKPNPCIVSSKSLGILVYVGGRHVQSPLHVNTRGHHDSAIAVMSLEHEAQKRHCFEVDFHDAPPADLVGFEDFA